MALHFWRDLSVIWLSLFCLLGLLLPIAALYFVVRGVNALHGMVQRLMQRGQTVSSQVRGQVTQVSTQVNNQGIRMQSQLKRAETVVRTLVGGRT